MRLIVNADDFGFSKGVNEGIIKCYTDGIVTSTTLMVDMPGTNDAVALMAKYPIHVGLHLNMTLGKPLTECKTLVKENGDFYKPKENPDQSKFCEDEIYQEFKAQMESFIKLTNKLPTHIDSHLYAHQVYEKAQSMAIRLADEYRVPLRDTKTNCYAKVPFQRWFRLVDGKQKAELKQELLNDVNGLLANEVTELMVHPAYMDDRLISLSSYSKQRLDELSILTDKEVREWIKNNQIELIGYNEIEGCKYGKNRT